MQNLINQDKDPEVPEKKKKVIIEENQKEFSEHLHFHAKFVDKD